MAPEIFARIVMQARDTQHLARRRIERDEGHSLRVIDMRERGDEFVAEVLHRSEEAPSQILRCLRRKERAIERFVLRPDRTDINGPSILQR